MQAQITAERGKRANTKARGVFGAEVLVDDDDGEAKFHEQGSGQAMRREVYGIRMKDCVSF
jgi:hypothetical protein